MKYRVKTTKRFDRQLKRCEKRGYDMHLIFDAMRLLAQSGKLPAEYRPHQLKGDHKGQIPEQTRLPAFGSATYSLTG